MRFKYLFSWIFIFSSCALLAIGRLYDARLTLINLNLPVLFSAIYFISSVFLFFSIRKIVISKTKGLFYLFYLLVFFTTPLLWIIFDVTEYGLMRFVNFFFIVVPISVIILERYSRKDVLNTLYVLLAVAVFLSLIGLFGLSASERTDGRMATLGGGPIVFGRWMGFGIISLFLLPLKVKKTYKYVLIVILFLLALASGSRGPVLALFLTAIVYVFLNFNKIIIKVILLVFLLVSVLFTSELGNEISELGNSKRVFMNIAKKGGSKQSTSTRSNLGIGAFLLLQNYPLGVGAGNFQPIVNKIRPTHLIASEYPHNLILEVACEYGLQTAFVLLLLLLYVFYLSYYKMIKYTSEVDSLYPLLFYLFLFLFLNSLVSGMLNDSRLLFVIMSFIIINKPLINTDE